MSNYADPSGRASKAGVCCRSFAGISGSNPAGGMDACVVSSHEDRGDEGTRWVKRPERKKEKRAREYKNRKPKTLQQ